MASALSAAIWVESMAEASLSSWSASLVSSSSFAWGQFTPRSFSTNVNSEGNSSAIAAAPQLLVVGP
ncbi:hypothetical protein ASE03_29850 [Kitasatospora sp. Root187]|nr:hypothetical protein ASC99_30060 [Kitasatospora sp. Root107]KRB68152.1 hypothetical protein ASE03_29850 [Kitasatospora sp. Root187]